MITADTVIKQDRELAPPDRTGGSRPTRRDVLKLGSAGWAGLRPPRT